MKNRKTAWLLALCLLGQRGVTPAYGAMAAGGDKAAANAETGTAMVNKEGRTAWEAGLASTEVQTKDVELNPNDGTASVPVEMKATVTASLISVSLPADGFDFTVDTEQTFDISTPSAQITSPDVTVVNHSVVPVKLEISSVPEVGAQDVRFSEKFSDYVEQSFRLVDTISGVGPEPPYWYSVTAAGVIPVVRNSSAMPFSPAGPAFSWRKSRRRTRLSSSSTAKPPPTSTANSNSA